MINKIIHIFNIIIFCLFFTSSGIANDQFDFEVNEINISNEGNFFKGSKGGTVKADNGLIIEAQIFEYDKIKNILNAYENVKIVDTINNYIIYSDEIVYLKNKEKIFLKENSRAYDNTGLIINADSFEYNKLLNILSAKKKCNCY